jgi:hypothetical protein
LVIIYRCNCISLFVWADPSDKYKIVQLNMRKVSFNFFLRKSLFCLIFLLAVYSILCYCFTPTLNSQCMLFNINVSVIDLLGTQIPGSFWWGLWSHSAGKVLVCVLTKNTGLCSFCWESNQHKAFPKLLVCNLLQNFNVGLNHFSELHLSLFSIYVSAKLGIMCCIFRLTALS